MSMLLFEIIDKQTNLSIAKCSPRVWTENISIELLFEKKKKEKSSITLVYWIMSLTSNIIKRSIQAKVRHRGWRPRDRCLYFQKPWQNSGRKLKTTWNQILLYTFISGNLDFNFIKIFWKPHQQDLEYINCIFCRGVRPPRKKKKKVRGVFWIWH